MGSADSAPDLRRRAETLREAARRARVAARGLGTYLDSVVRQATGTGTDEIWKGSYADSTSATLRQRSNSLHTMAGELLADAKRWDTAADTLDEHARHAAKPKSGN